MHTKEIVLTKKDVARFWAKVGVVGEGGCRLWEGGRNEGGYGRFWLHGKHCRSHRVAWVLTRGPIQLGMFVLHKCDNPPCVEGEHLFLGTNKDNMHDMHKKKRNFLSIGELNGMSKLTEGQVIELLKRYKSGETQVFLAKEYGICQPHVSEIVNRERWGYIKNRSDGL